MPNRHITVPERTLKKFSNNGKLSFLDLSDIDALRNNKISLNTQKCFMAEPNYYSDEIDKLFCDKIENRMSRLEDGFLKDINNMQIMPEKYRYWNDLHGFAKEVIAIQSLRNPDYTRKMFFPSFNVLDYEKRNGARDFVNMFLNPKVFPDQYNKYIDLFCSSHDFDAYRSMVLINKTDRDFFLPTTHYYRARLNPGMEECYVIVVSPKMTWVLLTYDDYKMGFEDKRGETVPRVADAETIKRFNYYALKFEDEYGSRKIISTCNELKKFDYREHSDFCNLLF